LQIGSLLLYTDNNNLICCSNTFLISSIVGILSSEYFLPFQSLESESEKITAKKLKLGIVYQ
jgi:hypothetical protein